MTALDNVRDNIDKLQYNSVFNTDKIVRSFAGSFLFGTQTTTRNYTLIGFPNNQQVFKIEHNLPRPCFVDLQWSLDNSSYWQGGGATDASNNGVIAYSDDTYIYIMPQSTMTNGTRVYYKILCSWIDDYDETNPDIDLTDNTPASYTQTFNSRTTAPSIISSGQLQFSTTSVGATNVIQTVPHGVSYAPEAKAFVEAFPGEVWPLNYGGLSNIYYIDDEQMEAQLFTTTTDVVVDCILDAGMGERKAWYVVYGSRGDYTTAVYESGTI